MKEIRSYKDEIILKFLYVDYPNLDHNNTVVSFKLKLSTVEEF